jgi:hypothetical protein
LQKKLLAGKDTIGRTLTNLDEIHQEIRAAQGEDVVKAVVGFKLVQFLPTFLFRFLLWMVGRYPQMEKRDRGTVELTAVGMFGEGAGWGIPPAGPTLTIIVGGIGEKPGVVDGHIAMRDYLSMTISFDHDIIDGAPAARFHPTAQRSDRERLWSFRLHGRVGAGRSGSRNHEERALIRIGIDRAVDPTCIL